MLREGIEKIQLIKIVDNRPLANTPDVYHLVLEAPHVAMTAVPGQFVMIKVSPGFEPTLRRPFSIHRLDKATGQIEIIYQIVGKGTAMLAALGPDQEVEILGPLGNGFDLECGNKVGLIGGGMGIAPLFAAAEKLAGEQKEIITFLGARTSHYLLAMEAFKKMGPVIAVTDDGSFGLKATVNEPVEKYLQNKRLDMLLACGPVPMLKSICALAKAHYIEAQLSLEQRMGCGVGACLGCVIPIRSDAPEGYTYQRVCHDGPVFRSCEVLFSVPEQESGGGGCCSG